MTTADILLVLILGGSFLVGFFQGVTRGVVTFFAFLIAFLLGANLWYPVGDYLARQWGNMDPAYAHMVSFGIVTLLIFGLFVGFIIFGRRSSRGLTPFPLLDDVLGGLMGVALALVITATVIMALTTVYGPLVPNAVYVEVDWSAQLHRALADSALGRLISDTLMPMMGTIFGPLLPPVVREAMV